MRKITEEAVDAFYCGYPYRKDNTEVYVDHEDTAYLYLFDNIIAVRQGTVVKVSHAGWRSNTTKERLNGVLRSRSHAISQKDGEWYVHRAGSVVGKFDELSNDYGWWEVTP